MFMRVVKRNYYDEEGNLLIKPYRLKDLAEIYGVCNRTMKKWITNAAPQVVKNRSQFYSIISVNMIINALGLPQRIETKKAA
jgi:hypothetical protein